MHFKQWDVIGFLWQRGTVLPHPLYIPDIASSDFYLFGALRDVIPGKMFASDDEVIEEVAAISEFKLLLEGERCSCFSLVRDC